MIEKEGALVWRIWEPKKQPNYGEYHSGRYKNGAENVEIKQLHKTNREVRGIFPKTILIHLQNKKRSETMKKFLLIAVSVLFIVTTISGCSSGGVNENSNNIVITEENIEDFVEMNLKIDRFYYNSFKETLDHSNSMNNVFTVTGDVTGISGYRYEDVKFTIRYNIESLDSGVESDAEISGPFETTVELSAVGNATVEDAFRLYLGTNDPSDIRYPKITYEITTASGTIYR